MTNSKLQIFTYQDKDVRTIQRNGELWFVLTDVCKILGVKNTSQMADRLDEDEKGICEIYTLGGPQNMVIINESGLYAVILRSNKPDAKKFRHWVTSEVLPAIRKTGSYQIPDAANPKIDLNSVLKVVQELRKTPAEQMPVVLDFLSRAGYPVGTYEEIYGQPPAVPTLPAPEQVSQQDSVQMFVNQIVPQLQWQFYSFSILFALYTNWVNREHICPKPLGRNKFVQTIASMADAGNIPNWYCPGRKHPVRPKRMMTGDEPLMAAYDVNIASYIGRASYTGIQRV